MEGAGATLDKRILAAGAAANCLAYMSIWAQPVLIAELVEHLHLSQIEAGSIVSGELAALSIIGMILARFLRGGTLRMLAVAGGVVALLASMASAFSKGFLLLLLTRMAAGVGEGIVFLACNLAIGRLDAPDRAYGRINFVNILFGIGLVSAIFRIPAQLFPTRTLPLLTLATMILAVLTFVAMPADLSANFSREKRSEGQVSAPTGLRWFVLITLFMPLGGTMVWAFYGILARRAGLTDMQIAHALSTSITIALIIVLAQQALGVRFGRRIPFAIGLVWLLVSTLLACLSTNPAIIWAAASIGLGGIYFILPYTYGAAAAADPSGRTLSIVASLLLIVSAASPLLGGVLFDLTGPKGVAGVAALATAIAWLSFRRATGVDQAAGSMPFSNVCKTKSVAEARASVPTSNADDAAIS